jgi:hypothetical protein
MPVTPFHFGPGLLIKSLIPGRFSFAAFIATQVVIDVETIYWILRDAWPVHRVLHTLPGGALAGALVACATAPLLPPLARWLAKRLPSIAGVVRARPHHLAAESRMGAALLGGLIGGVSHALLDGVMHLDIQPFRPLTTSNPLLNAVSLPALHLACTAAGALGLLLIALSAPQPDGA